MRIRPANVGDNGRRRFRYQYRLISELLYELKSKKSKSVLKRASDYLDFSHSAEKKVKLVSQSISTSFEVIMDFEILKLDNFRSIDS